MRAKLHRSSNNKRSSEVSCVTQRIVAIFIPRKQRGANAHALVHIVYSLVNNGVDRGRGGRQPGEVAQTLAGLLPVHQVVVVVAGRVEACHGVHGDVGLLAPVAVAPRRALGAHRGADPHSAATRISIRLISRDAHTNYIAQTESDRLTDLRERAADCRREPADSLDNIESPQREAQRDGRKWII